MPPSGKRVHELNQMETKLVTIEIAKDMKSISTQDDKHEILNQLCEGVRLELEDNHWPIALYNPLRFVVARKDLKRIVHAYVDKERMDRTDISGETTITKEFQRLNFQKVTLEAITIIIIIHHHSVVKDKQVTRKDLKTEYEIRGENISSWICEIIFKTSLGI